MTEDKLKFCWVRVHQSDSKMNDLRCLKDEKDRVVKIFDWDGNVLKHTPASRSVFYNKQYWKY